jgi:hypothetical protein
MYPPQVAHPQVVTAAWIDPAELDGVEIDRLVREAIRDAGACTGSTPRSFSASHQTSSSPGPVHRLRRQLGGIP